VDPLTSARRMDYYDDSDAPRASALVPSVNVVVPDGAGGIVLIRRTDNGNWALPGGAIDLGEARQEFSIVLARPLSGQPTPSSESSEGRRVPEAELPDYTMDRSMRIRINDFLARSDSPMIT
jgi:hypothetical protein